MTFIIIGFVFVLVISLLAAGARAQKTKATTARVEAVYKLDEKFVSPVDQCVVGLNFAEKTILLGNGRVERKYSFSDIVSVEVKENETTITNTNRGSQMMGAVVGGLLFGAGGALVGGLSGSARSRMGIRGLALKIVVDDLATPNYTIWFFKTDAAKGMSPDSVFVEPQIKHLERMHAQLLNAMRHAQHGSTQDALLAVPKPADNVDALGKLWELKQLGALTDSEFAAQKALLLSGDDLVASATLSAPTSVEPTRDVVVIGYRNKIDAIRAVREVLGLGLADAKRLVDSLPATLATGLSSAEASRMSAALRVHADIDLLET